MLIATSLNVGVGRCSETELMPRLATAGYDGVDFNFCDHLNRLNWFDSAPADTWVDELARAADAAELTWVQAHGPMFNLFSEQSKVDQVLGLCKPAIRACGRLGVPWMVLHPNTFSGPMDSSHPEQALERDVAFFRSLLPECEKHGVGIAIENIIDDRVQDNHHRGATFFGSVPKEQCQLIDALDHPLIGACWDTGHAKLMKLDQRSSLALLGPRLKVLHIQENDGSRDAHLLPFCNGPAGVDWRGVMAGLRDAGYGGAFTYEVHNALRPVPEPLFDATLRHSVAIARYLTRGGVAHVGRAGVAEAKALDGPVHIEKLEHEDLTPATRKKQFVSQQ